MGLIKPVDVQEVLVGAYGTELDNALKDQFNQLHQRSYFPKYKMEEILVRQAQYELWRMEKENRFTVPDGLVKFTPSGASKCRRELFYKAVKAQQDSIQQEPFNNRWTRNSSAIHSAVQRDLLYSNVLLKEPAFTMNMVETEHFGLLPAWEKNIETYKVIEHNDVKFVVSGMMDGLMTYNKTGQTIGFEFKTKSTDNYQIEKIIKTGKPAPHHVQQCVAYSLLFENENGEPLNDFIIFYEAVAKSRWDAGKSAYDDIKGFHITVTERQKKNLLKKYADVASMVETGELPKQEVSKCMFCPYKGICGVTR